MDTKELERKLQQLSTLKPMSDEYLAGINQLQKYVFDNTPQKLFRFRRCNLNNVSALFNDQLWFANPVQMNDDFDSMIYYDDNFMEKIINDFYDEKGNIRLYKYIKSSDLGVISQVSSVVGQQNTLEFKKMIDSLSNDEINERSHNFQAYLHRIRENYENIITTRLQSQVKFACFSETINSPLMWGLYADNSAGFALEYDMRNGQVTDCSSCKKFNKECKTPIAGMILPVVYTDKRYDATKAYDYLLRSTMLDEMLYSLYGKVDLTVKKNLLGDFDILSWANIIIHKSTEWKSEKEWRVIYTCPNDSSFVQ